jgi:hypothetical protein
MFKQFKNIFRDWPGVVGLYIEPNFVPHKESYTCNRPWRPVGL